MAVVEPDDPTALDEPITYSLADLAAASGVSARTIRYYQAEKVLPAPTKRGRDAVYRNDHVERLRLIGELRDRGLTLQTIRELVADDHPARTVSAWLGVDATLRAPWSDDRSRTMSQEDLAELVTRQVGERPGLIGELRHAGYVELNRDGSWTVPSPTLLDHALDLSRAGVDIDLSGQLRDLLRRRLSRAVDDTVKLFADRAGTGFAGTATPEELAVALGALRPIARAMSSVILAQEVERALADLVQSGTRPRRRAHGR